MLLARLLDGLTRGLGGVLPNWRLGAFEDVEATLRQSLARLHASPELPAREHIRGFVFNPETGELREVRRNAGAR